MIYVLGQLRWWRLGTQRRLLLINAWTIIMNLPLISLKLHNYGRCTLILSLGNELTCQWIICLEMIGIVYLLHFRIYLFVYVLLLWVWLILIANIIKMSSIIRIKNIRTIIYIFLIKLNFKRLINAMFFVKYSLLIMLPSILQQLLFIILEVFMMIISIIDWRIDGRSLLPHLLISV